MGDLTKTTRWGMNTGKPNLRTQVQEKHSICLVDEIIFLVFSILGMLSAILEAYLEDNITPYLPSTAMSGA